MRGSWIFGVVGILSLSIMPSAAQAADPPDAPPPGPAGGATGRELLPKTAEEPPWYLHRSWMPKDPVPPPRIRPAIYPLTGLLDGYAFTSGTVRGTASSVRADFGITPSFGVFAGFSLSNGYPIFGVDALRYIGSVVLYGGSGKDAFGIRLTPPHLELGLVVGGPKVSVTPAVSLFGLRFTHCSTHLVGELRPIVNLWKAVDDSDPATSVGVQLSVGYMFSLGGGEQKKKEEEQPKSEDEARAGRAPCYL